MSLINSRLTLKVESVEYAGCVDHGSARRRLHHLGQDESGGQTLEHKMRAAHILLREDNHPQQKQLAYFERELVSPSQLSQSRQFTPISKMLYVEGNLKAI